MPYEPNKIEKKWQDFWDKNNSNKAEDFSKKPKFYALIEFPYPSGAGLHAGHPRGYTAIDIVARKRRMEGYNVLFPIGWDAFGLPTENFAIKNGIHPSVATKQNVTNFKRQIKSLGFSFDWDREINTTDPEYYKWTQWIFLKLFEKGLAYQAKIPINWCPSCKIGLANEEAVGGKCERCGATVEQKEIKQWLLRITKYADRLIEDLKNVDYLEKIKTQQINWIGRSEGTEINFKIENSDQVIKVFTTRVDTIFGVTALVLAPENPLVKDLVKEENKKAVEEYIEESKNKTDFEREADKEKTGVFTGSYCLNPLNNEKVPIWVGDYVVASYGGGAVMMVPAHDFRDFDFAKKYGIAIKEVVSGGDISKEAFVDYGKLVNSGEFTGLDSKEAIKKITEWLEKPAQGGSALGGKTIHYKLRDWIFSRQHYWGEPIPIIHCDSCKNKKYRYLLLHGRHGSSQRDFFPWLKKELENLGHEVFAPDMPNTEDPKVEEQADFVIKNFKIDLDTIIIGHSLGGAVAFNILEKINKKVAKVLLVDTLIRPEFNDKKRPDLERNFHWKFNFEKIKKSADEFIDLADENFPIITKEQFEDKNKLLDTRLLYVKPNANHFNSAVEPLILEYAQNDGMYPVSEKDLPVELPFVEKYQPTGTGESPLAQISEWVNIKCPKCGGSAKRETDTMPNWAGSSWYYLAYCISENLKSQESISKQLSNPEIKNKIKYWMPVDWYNGGFEHTTLHLLYSRFWYKFLFDIGVAPQSEPYQKRTSNGVVLAEDGRKMSKSFGNVVNPDDIIKEFGADSLRLYEMFMGPFDQAIAWSTNGLRGCYRFLTGLWDFTETVKDKKSETEKEGLVILNKAIKKVGEDIEEARFNTAISALMELMNYFKGSGKISKIDLEKIIRLIAPFAPHVTEEIWNKLGNKKSIFEEKWPEYDKNLIKDEIVRIVVQVNGKLRDTVEVKAGLTEEEAKKLAISQKKIENWIAGKEIKKVIFVPNKLINIVI